MKLAKECLLEKVYVKYWSIVCHQMEFSLMKVFAEIFPLWWQPILAVWCCYTTSLWTIYYWSNRKFFPTSSDQLQNSSCFYIAGIGSQNELAIMNEYHKIGAVFKATFKSSKAFCHFSFHDNLPSLVKLEGILAITVTLRSTIYSRHIRHRDQGN